MVAPCLFVQMRVCVCVCVCVPCVMCVCVPCVMCVMWYGCRVGRYPNLPAFQAAASAHPGVIDFSPTPVNATQCSEPCELRTQFASFHHFAPNSAVALLADAVRASQAIAIFE